MALRSFYSFTKQIRGSNLHGWSNRDPLCLSHVPLLSQVAGLRSFSPASVRVKHSEQEVYPDTTKSDAIFTKEVIQKVNKQVEEKQTGRLWGVVYVRNQQYKVTPGDLLQIQYDWQPSAGDELKFEKVLAVGCKDFTLIGQPLLSRSQVLITGTVIEKTLSHTHVFVNFTPRSVNNKSKILVRDEMTTVRINDICILKPIQEEAED